MTASYKNQKSTTQLDQPRFQDAKALLIAGVRQEYKPETMNQIPDQWKRFMPHIGKVPGQIGRITYGLCYLNKDSIGYLAGVEVSSCDGLPSELTCAEVPAQRYAVFTHRGHVSQLWETCEAIQNQWFPTSGYQP